MTRWRKLPVEIEAIQFDGDFDKLHEFVGEGCSPNRDGSALIFTLEGEMRASIGDFIIRGVKGEFYPCKPDIFAQTYEAVDG